MGNMQVQTARPLLIVTAFFAASVFSQVQVGAGNYMDAGNFAVPPGKPYVTDDFKQPIKTAQWWVTLITKPFSDELHALPLSFKATAKGMEVGYPGAPQMFGSGFASVHAADLTVGVEGMTADAAKVSAYSHFSVTARWQGGGKTLEATIGHGLPFAYFKVAGGNAQITLAGTIWYNQAGTLGVTVGGRSYGIFAPTGSVWTGTGTLTSGLNGKDYLSVAVLPDGTPETLAFFRKYAFSFVTKTKVAWYYVESS